MTGMWSCDLPRTEAPPLSVSHDQDTSEVGSEKPLVCLVFSPLSMILVVPSLQPLFSPSHHQRVFIAEGPLLQKRSPPSSPDRPYFYGLLFNLKLYEHAGSTVLIHEKCQNHGILFQGFGLYCNNYRTEHLKGVVGEIIPVFTIPYYNNNNKT